MKYIFLLLCLLSILQDIVGPPVTQKKNEDAKSEENENDGDHLGTLGIEYNRYLKEVVTALESDPDFRSKLEKAEEVDIRTGKIAQELEYVNHQVRTKLDELKRQELERLRHLAMKEYELRNGIDTEHLKIPPEHLDHSNPHTFEIEDLRKLITKTTADLAAADKKRRQEFKEYEMQKEYEKHEKLKNLTDEQKQQLEKEMEEKEKKHKQHDPLHHPGSKQQLEEVWEKQDHMENQDFDPKTFFFLHDLDGNGAWDEAEVKALFLKELDKLYNSGAPEDDMRERVEEMERMREHVFSEADTNKDGLISFEEFLAQTRKPDFEKDQGWESLDQQQVYTREEYQEFERQRQAEVQRMIDQGLIPPYPHGMVPPPQGMQQPHHPSQFPSQQHPVQYHPNQIPPGQFQGPYQAGHVPQMQQGAYPQVPQGGYQQMQQGQYAHGQPPQVNYNQAQHPQGQYGNIQQSQNQVHGNNVPLQEALPNQVPQAQAHNSLPEVHKQEQQQQEQQLQQNNQIVQKSNEIPQVHAQAAETLPRKENKAQVNIPQVPVNHPKQPIENEIAPTNIESLRGNPPAQQPADHLPS